MKWELRVTLRDGRTAGVLYDTRDTARIVMREIAEEFMGEDLDYWLGSGDSRFLVRADEFWGVEVIRVDAP